MEIMQRRMDPPFASRVDMVLCLGEIVEAVAMTICDKDKM
jgi:hypothetical protein